LPGLEEIAVLNSKPYSMDLRRMSDPDKALVGQALRAAADGPFFPDWEFHTLFGLNRDEVRAIADDWPNVDLSSSDVVLAVNNSLNNLLGYPHRQGHAWSRWISVSPHELDELFCRLSSSSTTRYIDRMM
jgi:hypothetical protein